MNGIIARTVKPFIETALGDLLRLEQRRRERQFASIERFRGLVVAAGLRKLFERQGSFSICQLDHCIEAADIVPDGETMRILRPLHCIKYADMSKELRDEVFSRVMAMFGVELLE